MSRLNEVLTTAYKLIHTKMQQLGEHCDSGLDKLRPDRGSMHKPIEWKMQLVQYKILEFLYSNISFEYSLHAQAKTPGRYTCICKVVSLIF